MAILETLTVSEAAVLRGVDRDTIYKAIERGEIDEVRCGKIKRVLKRDALNWSPDKPGPKKREKANDV